MKLSPNDPCPCGSGRNYKKCCLARNEAAREENAEFPPTHNGESFDDPELATWKEADRHLIRRGMERIDHVSVDFAKLIEKYWGKDVLQRWKKEGVSESEIKQSTIWLWLDWRRTANSKTIAEEMMSDSSLTEPQRQILASLNASHTGVYQVVRLDPGRGAELEDVLQGGRIFVHDRSFSLSTEKWVLLFCRVYSAGPYNFMAGGGFGFPPREKEFIRLYLTHELLKYQRKSPAANWGEFLKMKAEVFGALTGALSQRMAQLPFLINTAGETLVLCKARFTVRRPEEVLAGLRSCPELEEDAQDDRDQHEFVWCREVKNEPIVHGRFFLKGNELVFECNSKERLSRGTELVKKIGDVELVEKEVKDARKLLEEMRKEGTPASLVSDKSPDDPPEVQAYLRQLTERHYEEWADQPLPALDGMTPRQAAKRRASRPKLVDLIREIEFMDRGREAHLRFDWNKVRRRLGLAEE